MSPAETRRRRFAIFATHPIQYHCPVWRELARRPDLEVCVFFGSDFSVRGYRDTEFGVDFSWDVPLTDGYRYVFLEENRKAANNDGFFSIGARGLRRRLAEFQPDVALIGGYMRWFWLRALFELRRRGVPVVMRSEATDEAFPRGRVKSVARNLVLSAVYARCSRFLVPGRAGREHYERRGISPTLIGWCPYIVDSTYLERQRERLRGSTPTKRAELGLDGCRTVFLFSGKLVARKGPLLLAGALGLLDEVERREIGLIVLGDGEQRRDVESSCRTLLGDRAVFPGFVNQSEIAAYLDAADCLVMPSAGRETWGLVVNEALHFHRPAIVSDQVGCASELVEPNRTGFVFPAGDTTMLAQYLLIYHRLDAARRAEMSAACAGRVASFTVEVAADRIREAAIDAVRDHEQSS